MKKYKINRKDYIIIDDKKLYRIISLIDFSNIRKREKGGYIQTHQNLSHTKNCWIYNNSMVYGNARVSENAKIYGNSKIYGNAKISGNVIIDKNVEIYGDTKIYNRARIYNKTKIYENAQIYGYAIIDGTTKIYGNANIHGNTGIYGNAEIYGNADVFGNADVYGNAKISGFTRIRGNTKIYENAKIHGNAKIYGNVNIYDDAEIYGNAEIYGTANIYGKCKIYGSPKIYDNSNISKRSIICKNAKVYGESIIRFNILTTDIKKNIEQLIFCSLNILPDNKGDYILYKKVNKRVINKVVHYKSLWNSSFEYYMGKYTQLRKNKYDNDFNTSCSSGLHVSTINHWEDGNCVLQVKVNIKNIITCMGGKIRCKKLKVLKEINYPLKKL